MKIMRTINDRYTFAGVFTFIVLASSIALAGDVDVIGDGSVNGSVLEVNSTSTTLMDVVAVRGQSTPSTGFGIGGVFKGSHKGVAGYAIMDGFGERIGGDFSVGGGNAVNRAVHAMAVSVDSAQHIGVWGEAGGGSSNFGVYGWAGVNGGGWNAAGFFNGSLAYTGNFGQMSDESVKTDIEDLDDAVDQLMQIKPKVYRYRTEEKPDINLPEGYHMGMVAQDLERVFPDMVTRHKMPVKHDPNDNNSSSTPNADKEFLFVNYVELVPVLVKAIQEQQQQIEDLQHIVGILTNKNKNK
jgi:hypothetical protein